jgi:type VI secretion system protein VasJ
MEETNEIVAPQNNPVENVTETVIPEFVKEYLEPIPGDSPTGSDASNCEEYFKLNMEIPKTTPDYKKCIEFSDIILKEKSKDIKVATWLCFALFRVEKIKGLKDGLAVIYYFLVKYNNSLFPSNVIHRSKAIQFLNSTRFFKLVEREEINRLNANDVIEADNLLVLIMTECEKLYPGIVPVLKSFKEVLENHAEKAKQLLAPPKKTDEKPTSVVEQKTSEKIAETVVESHKIQTTVIQAEVAPKEIKLSSEKDATAQLKQVLLYFFEELQDGVKKEKVPNSHFVFGISRQLQWGKMVRPADTDKVTQIPAPNQVMLGKIREQFASGNWDILIPRVEINFIKSDLEFTYWLDAQRFVVKALEQKGGIYLQASEDIKINLAKQLLKIPDLPMLKFKDKQTPFADEETIKWINDDVKTILGGTKSDSIILPPIIGEDYNPINEEYKAACDLLPQNFEENVDSMQKGIEADTRKKGRFLRRLNLANFCLQAKHYDLAKVNLLELKKIIEELNLAGWEAALCTSVWQSIYLVNVKLLSETAAEELKINLQKEQQELFTNIAKYDGLLALKISQKNL